MMPLTDAYALRGVARSGLNYGPLRLWGSAAFVAGALRCRGAGATSSRPRHLIWIIAALALRAPLPASAAAAARPSQGRTSGGQGRALCCCAIAIPRHHRGVGPGLQGGHAAYYTFASISWQAVGLGGLTIAGLWVLGVLAEIVGVRAVAALLRLPPALLVVIGALSAVARWLITAQEPSVAVLAVVQLAHGLTWRTHPGGHHEPSGASRADPHDGARAKATRGLRRHGHHGGIDPVGRGLCGVRSATSLRDGGDGARCRCYHVARARVIGASAPQARRFRRIDQAAVVAQALVAVAGQQQGSVQIDEPGLLRERQQRSSLASEVATMQPIMISKPSARAASAIASASVSPPVLSSLMIDGIVARAKACERGAIVHAFIGADRDRPLDRAPAPHPARPEAAARPASRRPPRRRGGFVRDCPASTPRSHPR